MAATDVISHDEVVRAGRVLFGPGFAADQAWWRDALRSTYRRRALETHPDRARALGRSESDLAREFGALSDAYRILSQMRAGPMPHAPPPSRAPRAARSRPVAHRSRASATAASPPPRETRAEEAAPTPTPPPRDGAPRVRVGVRPQDLPRRRLRFAEYLYYSGRVPWTAFVDAIVWQRSQRPAIGRIAVEFGFLSPEAVAEILERRRLDAAQAVPFGEYALRSGYLTSFQLLAALGQQLRLQRRIGEFFVERGLIDALDVDDIRARLSRHNVRY
jgi:hypothetical protein